MINTGLHCGRHTFSKRLCPKINNNDDDNNKRQMIMINAGLNDISLPLGTTLRKAHILKMSMS